MFCPKCGNQLVDGAKFCNACGAPIGKTQAAPAGHAAYAQAPRAQAVPSQRFAPQAGKLPAVGNLFGSNKLLAIASIVAAALLIVALNVTIVSVSLAGSTYDYNVLILSECISKMGAKGLTSISDACHRAMLVAAFFGVISIAVFIAVKSIKVRSIIEIVLGVLAAFVGFLVSWYVNQVVNQLGALVNNSLISSVTGSGISAGHAATLVMLAGIVIIAVNVVMMIDDRKALAAA